MEGSQLKTSSIRPVVSMEHRLVTDTDGKTVFSGHVAKAERYSMTFLFYGVHGSADL